MWKMVKNGAMNLLTKVGWAGAGVATIAGGAAAIGGPGGTPAKLLENAQSALKNVDAITDVDGLFTRLARFLQNIVKMFNNFGDIANQRVNTNTLFSDENDQNANPSVVQDPKTALGQKVANTLDNNVVGKIVGQGADLVEENPKTAAVIGTTVVAATALSLMGKSKTPTSGDKTPEKVAQTPKTISEDLADVKARHAASLDGGNTKPVSIIAEAADDVAKSSLRGSLLKGFTRNALGAVVIGGGLYAGSKIMGATEAEAQDLATDIIPGKDAVLKVNEGEYVEAAQSAVVDAAGFAGFIPGAMAGATLGASAGALTGPFAVVASPVGGVVGGLVGGVITSGIASTAADYAWEGGEYVFSKGVDAVNYFWGDDEPAIKTEFSGVADNDNRTPKYVADNVNTPIYKPTGMDMVMN